MKRSAIWAGAALAMAAATACARQEPAENMVANDGMVEDDMATDSNLMAPAASMLSDADKAFLDEAIRGDIAETQVGQLVAEKGQSQAAKELGAMLSADHSAHLAKLTALAQQNGVTVPSEPSDAAKAMHDSLSSKTGAEFDSALKSAMIADHEKNIAKYQQQASGSGPLAALAKETVPVLQKHLDAAKKI